MNKYRTSSFLSGYSEEAQRYVAMFTVPLLRFGKNIVRKNWNGYFSGVLLQIEEHYFVITAGHCTKGQPNTKLLMGIQKKRHTFEPQIVRTGTMGKESEGTDVGYIEIAKSTARTARALEKNFLQRKDLEIITADENLNDKDEYIFAGFPGDWFVEQQMNTGGEAGMFCEYIPMIEPTPIEKKVFSSNTGPTVCLDIIVSEEGLFDLRHIEMGLEPSPDLACLMRHVPKEAA